MDGRCVRTSAYALPLWMVDVCIYPMMCKYQFLCRHTHPHRTQCAISVCDEGECVCKHGMLTNTQKLHRNRTLCAMRMSVFAHRTLCAMRVSVFVSTGSDIRTHTMIWAIPLTSKPSPPYMSASAKHPIPPQPPPPSAPLRRRPRPAARPLMETTYWYKKNEILKNQGPSVFTT